MAQFHYDTPFIDPFRHGDEPTGYAMVKTAPAVEASECELPGVPSLEVMILWGDTVLHVAHLTPPRAFSVGEASTSDAPCDFILPAQHIGASRAQLIEIIDGVPHVGKQALAAGERSEITLGGIVVRVTATCAGKPTTRRAFGATRSTALSFGLASAMAAAFVGAMAFFTPALGLADDASAEQDRAYDAQRYLAASAEREREAEQVSTPDAPAQTSGAASGAAATGADGAMGKPTAAVANRRFGIKGPKENPDPHLAREAALRDAASFGMIGILNNIAGDANAPTAPWGRDSALGNDDASAQGNMWGPELGEARGSGGLGLSGTGAGGGGRGEGVGLGQVGTCGKDVCPGLGGFGRFVANTGGPGHDPHAPQVRPGETTMVGTLPPGVIQRVVRQNFGRFRQCYETGLRANPNLAGRVAVRFVIARDGSVSNASNGGSDLPDSGVVSCVVRAYYGLSFPAPQNGIVTVSYPIAFSPG